MPVTIPYPYFELRFDAKGKSADAKQLPALLAGIKKKNVTDLFIVSHGWNNDHKEANALYSELFTNVKAAEKHVPSSAGRSFAVAGVIWPSKKFDAAEDKPNAASVGGAKGIARVKKQIDNLKAIVADGPNAAKRKKSLDRAKVLLAKIEKDPKAKKEFAERILECLPDTVSEEGDRVLTKSIAKGMNASGDLLDRLGSPPPKVATRRAGTGGATSMSLGGGGAAAGSDRVFEGAAGLGDFFKGIVAGASNLLNYVTYYQMKDRAATVGRAGVNAAISAVRKAHPSVRIHLVGHSFGCRVVTAAVTGSATNVAGFANSMSLLQGAFSHYSFSASYDKSNKPGFFRNLIAESRVSGPVVITHTRADKAVGIAYAVASRAARQIAAAVGDKDDPFGGLGSNGAQKTAEARSIAMPSAGTPFSTPLGRNTLTNLLADKLIANHGDVRNKHCAYVVLSAACTG